MSTFSRHSGPVGIVKLLVAPSFLPSPESARVAQLAERVVVANPGKVQQMTPFRVTGRTMEEVWTSLGDYDLRPALAQLRRAVRAVLPH